MATTSACPQVSDLQQLTTGDVPPEQLEDLVAHLESCAGCLAKVQTLSSPDTLVDALTKASTMNEGPDEEIVTQLIARLKKLGQAAAPQPLTFACVDCGKKLKIKAELAGKKVKCPGCGKAVLAPMPADVSEEKTILPAANISEQMTLQPSNVDATVDAPAKPLPDANDTHAMPKGDADSELWDFLAPPEQADEIGRLGPYRVLKVLGSGGMGVVFRAEDPHLERAVALKAMLPSLAASPSAKKRFLREAKAAAALKHDNVVAIYQVGEDRGAPFLAMEFLEGEPLNEHLDREGKLPVSETVRIGTQIAAGLAAAHDKGLIHRDIKPGNIWLEANAARKSGEARVKILDFGLARSVGDQAGLTQQGAMVGTPAYMAPEQAIGKDVDHRCDLFSLGCVLYRMATGHMPFKGNDTLSILSSLALDNPQTPLELNPMMPAELSDLIVQLLAKNPADRPVSAHEVIERLSALETDAAPPRKSVRKPSDTVPAPRVRKRSMTLTALGALGCLLLTLLGGGVFYIVTDNGTIEIKTDDPTVKIIVEKNGQLVTLLDPASKQTWVVNTGTYSLRLDGNPSGLEIELPKDRTFAMKRGGKQIVTIRRVHEPLAKVAPAKGPAGASPSLDPAWLRQLAALPAAEQQQAVADRLNAPVETTNKIGMKLRLIPPGFRVDKAFYLGKYEVTQGEWETVMGYNFSHFGRQNAKLAGMDTSKFPVEMMSWFDSVEFCNKLSEGEGMKPYYELTVKKRSGPTIADAEVKKLGGSGYHIPTDLEWEHGCRAGTNTKYYCGNKDEDLLEYAWFNKNSEGRTHAVGEKKPNAFGLFDMLGNVREWNEEMLTNAASGAPERVCRGGACIYPADFCTLRNQQRVGPASRSNNFIGLRVARAADGSASAPVPPLDPAWVKAVAAMTTAKQVDAVKAELMKRNPGFDGQIWHEIQGGQVASLEFRSNHVADISPVRALVGLKTLKCSANPGKARLADLSPLKGMQLTYLDIGRTQVTDLGPLAGMPLAYLDIYNLKVMDLLPLKDLTLTVLKAINVPATDLSPIKGVPLRELYWNVNRKRDGDILRSIKTLEKINGKPAAQFWEEVDAAPSSAPLSDAWLKQVAALSTAKQVAAVRAKLQELNPGFDGKVQDKVKGGAVTEFGFDTDKITDISPVRALAGLQTLHCGSFYRGGRRSKFEDLSQLKGMKLTSLDCSGCIILNDLSPLKEMKLTTLHFTDTRVADLSPLKDMPLTELIFNVTRVSDLSALKAMKLNKLECNSTEVRDLSPLKGMPLTSLNVGSTKVTDLSALKDMPLTSLSCERTNVADLAPLKGMKLTSLFCNNTRVTDLTPLKGTNLQILHCDHIPAVDFSPLKELPLRELNCDFNAKRDSAILRSIKTLEKINGKLAAQFWKEVDSGTPKSP